MGVHFLDIILNNALSVAAAVITICLALALNPSSTARRIPGPWLAKVSSLWLVLQCRRVRRTESVMEQHGKHGDFVLITPHHISINNPSAAHQIYGHRSGLTKSPFYKAFQQVEPAYFNTLDPQQHARKRKYITPAFSARALADFEPMMDVEVGKWARALLQRVLAKQQKTLDFVVWTNFLAFDVISSFAFGAPFGFIERGEDYLNLIKIIDIRGEVLNALGSLPEWLRPLMKYNYCDRFWRDGLRATSNLGTIGQEAYLGRKNSTTERKDLLSYLFAAGQSGVPVYEEEIVAESISFIIGGSDTTSSTMSNAIDLISRDESVMQKLTAELDDWFPGEQQDDWVPANKELANMPYLNAALREAMRLRPTSQTGLERVVPAEGKVICDRFIPGGMVVSMPTFGLLHDARIFDCPDRYYPERWLTDQSTALLEHFLPFSCGPRACVGRNFAWMEVLKALAVVFKQFDVRRATTDPTVIREGFFAKAAECKVQVQRRSL